jgi:hypothetical protein
MLDWVTLRFIEHAPDAVWIITGVISVAILAVLQSREWLDFRGRWYFSSFIGFLLVSWIGVIGYAYLNYHSAEKPHVLSADEIAAAIVRFLPKSPTPANATTIASPAAVEPRNPLATDNAKWQAVSRIYHMLDAQNIGRCKVVIVRYQLPYAENFADDLKAILIVAKWDFEERFASTQVPKGLSIRTVDKAPVTACAQAFARAITSGATIRGGTWGMNVNWIDPTKGSPYLRDCPDCVEVDIGNEPE